MSSECSTFDYAAVCNIPEVLLRVELLAQRLEELQANRLARVLEVGVGSGDVTLMLAERFDRVTCVEPDEKNCRLVSERLLRQNRGGVEFIQTPVEQVTLSAEKYDHIVLLGVLEHLGDPKAVLRQLGGNCRTAGCMHIVVNLAGSLHRRLGVAMNMIEDTQELSQSDVDLGHYRIYTRDELCDQICSAGLRITYEQAFYLKPLPTSMLTGLSMEIHRGLYRLGEELAEFASYIYVEARR